MRRLQAAPVALSLGRATRGQLDREIDPTRYGRICRTHRKPLVELPSGALQCPGDAGLGAHTTVRWIVIDREKRIALHEANAESKTLELEVQELRRPLHQVPHRELPPEGGEEVNVPRGVPGSGVGTKGGKTLEKAKLTFKSAVLWLRLERNAGKDDASRFRVRWQVIKGDKTEGGVAAAMANEPDARKAFKDELADALKRKWVQAPTSARLELKPVPAPPGA